MAFRRGGAVPGLAGADGDDTGPMTLTIDDILNPQAPPTRVVTGRVSSANADLAIVDLPGGGQGYIALPDWYAKPLPAVGSFVTAMRVDGAFHPRLSVTGLDLPKAVLEGLVPEMHTGVVRVMGVAREPGVRCKIAVAATVEGVDPVAAAIGRRANRVRELSRQLRGEQVDVVAWASTPAAYAATALAPVGVIKVEKTERGHLAAFVAPHQQSAAVGHGGVNARLASQLVGKDIIIRPDR